MQASPIALWTSLSSSSFTRIFSWWPKWTVRSRSNRWWSISFPWWRRRTFIPWIYYSRSCMRETWCRKCARTSPTRRFSSYKTRTCPYSFWETRFSLRGIFGVDFASIDGTSPNMCWSPSLWIRRTTRIMSKTSSLCWLRINSAKRRMNAKWTSISEASPASRSLFWWALCSGSFGRTTTFCATMDLRLRRISWRRLKSN